MNTSRVLLIASSPLLLWGCSDRPGFETGEKIFNKVCVNCHMQDKNTMFLQHIPPSSLGRTTFLSTVTKVQNAEGHGDKHLDVIDDLSRSEAEKVTKYLYELKEHYANEGSLHRINLGGK